MGNGIPIIISTTISMTIGRYLLTYLLQHDEKQSAYQASSPAVAVRKNRADDWCWCESDTRDVVGVEQVPAARWSSVAGETAARRRARRRRLEPDRRTSRSPISNRPSTIRTSFAAANRVATCATEVVQLRVGSVQFVRCEPALSQ